MQGSGGRMDMSGQVIECSTTCAELLIRSLGQIMDQLVKMVGYVNGRSVLEQVHFFGRK